MNAPSCKSVMTLAPRVLRGPEGLEELVGESAALKRVLDEVRLLAAADINVHVQGETGTGKELVAAALHRGSARAGGPFVAQNCAGMPETLLHSVLFGHRRGAFTGAERDHAGVFQAAHGGTLFLDEVAELSPAAQACLLRALQQGEVLPVGASRPENVDVRVVSATHKDLRAEARAGRFREDLYFRLVVVSARLPALRERTGDVPLLACHLLALACERLGKRLRGFTPEAMTVLEHYSWPGNVRELQNEVMRSALLAEEGDAIRPDHLSPHLRPSPALAPERARTYDEAVTDFERALIEHALLRAGGVVAHAAAALGMERSRLAKMRRRLGLSVTPCPDDEGPDASLQRRSA